MTEELIRKLEEGFMLWLTDEEACLFADISTTRFYEYQAENPKFKARKEELKKTPNMHAKRNWVNEIKGGNYQASKEWLERRAKDEFSLKQELDTKFSGEVKIDSITIK